MHRPEFILDRSYEDHVFTAQVPELPRCIADADSWEYALRNVNDAGLDRYGARVRRFSAHA